MTVWKVTLGAERFFFVFATRKESLQYMADFNSSEELKRMPNGHNQYNLEPGQWVLSRHDFVYWGA